MSGTWARHREFLAQPTLLLTLEIEVTPVHVGCTQAPSLEICSWCTNGKSAQVIRSASQSSHQWPGVLGRRGHCEALSVHHTLVCAICS